MMISKKWQGAPSRLTTTLAVALLAIGLPCINGGTAHAACEAHKIDLGEGKSVTGGCAPLRIAFINIASNNTYLQANIKGAQDAAKAAGASIQVFDANWDLLTQHNQAEMGINGGDYNAVVADVANANDPAWCKLFTETAPAKNILVSIANQPVCNRYEKEGDGYWSPGTLNYVGGTQGFDAFRTFIMKIAADNPGRQEVAVITGPELNVQSRATDAALKEAQAMYPGFKVVAEARTDYSVLQSNQKMAPILQAHPNLTILITNYSDMTRGAVQAINQAGKKPAIKVYDSGGNTWAFQAVRDGDIVLTRTYTPYDELYKSVSSLAAAWKGEATPRYVPLESAYVTKDNVDKYKPQY
jgi:ribose transport system substrate-binding protein